MNVNAEAFWFRGTPTQNSSLRKLAWPALVQFARNVHTFVDALELVVRLLLH